MFGWPDSTMHPSSITRTLKKTINKAKQEWTSNVEPVTAKDGVHPVGDRENGAFGQARLDHLRDHFEQWQCLSNYLSYLTMVNKLIFVVNTLSYGDYTADIVLTCCNCMSVSLSTLAVASSINTTFAGDSRALKTFLGAILLCYKYLLFCTMHAIVFLTCLLLY